MSEHAPQKTSPIEKIRHNLSGFLFLFLLVFASSAVVLESIGAIPPTVLGSAPSIVPTGDRTTAIEDGEYPVRIEIPSVGVRANVSNPNTTNIQALDRELLSGAVRYPGTGLLGEKGNVLMFGHSSYLPVVHNQAYKAFNDIQHLKKGDVITVYGETRVYFYEVDEVREENTTTGEISLDVSGAKLTLATCDTFGAKSDRFIVTASVLKDLLY